jgi:anti-sigma factor RsiW
MAESPDIEMYFYGELDPLERARVERHLGTCEPCRHRLADLQAIRRLLASRPLVDAPPAGDWSGFTHRLDSALTRDAEPSNLRTLEPQNLRTSRTPRTPRTSRTSRTLRTLRTPRTLRPLLAFAALLALITIGAVIAARFRTAPGPGTAVNTPVIEVPPQNASTAAAQPARALRERSAEHLERSKLVVLGLATRDPNARSDWQYERALAGTLLTDTRLYRQAAIQGGAPDVERVMRDLETVLLEASMSDKGDRAALERVQRLIAKRDLVVKMQGVTAAGPSGN